MPLLPKQHAARIAFFKSRLPVWTAAATAIGTTSAAVTALGAAVTAAETALANQLAQQNAAKAGTATLDQAITTIDNLGMTIVEQVRTKARSTGDSVYPIADLPVPATPSSRPAPGTPTNYKAILKPDGTLAMTWTCANPAGSAGTVYQVYRSIGGSTEFAIVGGSGQRKFTDVSIPAGVTQLTYKIQAVRSTAVGDWATFNVFFGSNAGGTTTLASVEAVPVKIAA